MTELEIVQKRYQNLKKWQQEAIRTGIQFLLILSLYEILRYTNRHKFLTLGIIVYIIMGRILWRKFQVQILSLLHLKVVNQPQIHLEKENK